MNIDPCLYVGKIDNEPHHCCHWNNVTFDNLKQVLVIYMGPSDEYITTKFITFGVIVSHGMQIGLG